MTTAVRTFSWDAGDETLLRAWAANVAGIFDSVGLVRTNHPGQLDPATVPYNATASFNHGFMMWTFPDAANATTPVYVRVEFHNRSSGTIKFVRLLAGMSVDAAGTITGTVYGSALPTQTPTNTIRTSYACYVDGSLGVVIGYDWANATVPNGRMMTNILLDRPRNDDGTTRTGGLLAYWSGYNLTSSWSHHYHASATGTSSNGPIGVPNRSANNSAEGTDMFVFPLYMLTPSLRLGLGAVGYFNGELSPLAPITVPLLGEDHTYLPMGYNMPYFAVSSNDGSLVAAMRWE